MSETKTWSVSGTVTASTFVGEFKAKSGKEAIKKAWKEAYINVCHHCAESISDPEVTALTAECGKTGEVVTSTDESPSEPKPRRTLADVVANPPEGWVVYRASDITLDFHWRPVDGRAQASVTWTHGLRVDDRSEEWVRPAKSQKDKAAAHRAVADLLDVLAEVSDV